MTWLVQTGGIGKGAGNDYGVVSDGHGFEDSPDCERISGGVASKGPRPVAIGREANLLQWGFYAAPDRMTDSARRTFLNALVYMRQFDGARPLVSSVAQARGWMDQYVEGLAKETTSASLRSYYLARFPRQARAQAGDDPQKLAAWLAENREVLYQAPDRALTVDEDLRDLGLSNRRPELLDWLVATLREDPLDARAGRLARRYLGEHGDDAAKAIAWIEASRGRMFFSDVGGYRWFVDTRDGPR